MVVVAVGAGAVVVVVVVAGTVVVVVVEGGVVVVVVAGRVVVVVAVAGVVVGARVVSPVEVGLEDGAGGGVSGAVIVVAEVIEVLEAGGSARVGVSSDPVRHAPRSNGTTTEAASRFPIGPERRAVREQCCRANREVPPVALGVWSWPPSG